jgi:hypothetical protein
VVISGGGGLPEPVGYMAAIRPFRHLIVDLG